MRDLTLIVESFGKNILAAVVRAAVDGRRMLIDVHRLYHRERGPVLLGHIGLVKLV